MKALEIDKIEVYAIGPEITRYKWVWDMTEQFMTHTILRVYTRGGLEGVAGAISFSEYGFSSAVAETLRRMAPDLLGISALDREALWHRFRRLDFPTAPQAQSLMDIALWDLAAKAADMPLYQFLGGARSKILSYASTPLLESEQAYIDAVADLKARGFKAIKFHCWCDIVRDLPMVKAVHRKFGSDPSLRFMLDAEMRYSPADALRAGKVLEELDYAWFEAPLIDTDLNGYRQLRRSVSVPIVPAGNWLLAPGLIEAAIQMGCWSSARIDVTVAGGFTPSRKIMAIAAANSMNVEIQCWGYVLTQAANLHLMLAYDNCTYFEQPIPFEPYEFGAIDVIRTDSEGFVHAPSGPGLGIRMDWEAVRSVTFLHYEMTSRKDVSERAESAAPVIA
jgi:L-alanine-DL-glutamate epimerase-like enolase superfamily enzyme